MTTRSAALAVLLRKTQWLLDDLAFEVGAGRADQVDFAEVIDLLESVTAMLRDEQQQTPHVIDGATESGQDG
ncbi:hypothetical protein E1161_21645 [Saccharopolyspora aridisoli]|uniref:Uncharacterized protein n=1 Tax=Saccharopolyspora aridisoli TaxID=2530385 RepID=A0A4R4UCR7_9PSEU|nr:hypothetical protein [Saccharopolyspora aridisoli]TDC89301.1 hypothetical protein E1161_21645 [Saccharopolyspora aridisoli]